MQVLRTAATAAGLSLYFQVMPAAAQIDYRNLDDDRPLTAEYPNPVEGYACDFLAPHPYDADSAFRLEATSIIFSNKDEV
jgi:hypothetical protein